MPRLISLFPECRLQVLLAACGTAVFGTAVFGAAVFGAGVCGGATCEADEPAAAVVPHDHSEARSAGLDPGVLRELDTAMQAQVDKGHVSGVIGFIFNNERVGYFETFGYRNIEAKQPMTKDSLFRIFSMTKPIVVVTALSLWEEGRFGLDDPVSDHLPEWKDVRVQNGDKSVPAEKPVTPRHLMTHSAGLSYDRTGLALGPDDSLQAFSESVAARPLLFQPGTDYRYGYSIDILGRYLEAVTGSTLDRVMRERVLDPLKMSDTEFWLRDPKDKDRVAIVYTKRDGRLVPLMTAESLLQKPPRMMGGQGLIGTTGDYARFCQMLMNKGELDGVRILKPSTVELMCRNHLADIRKTYGLGGMVDGKGQYSWGGAAGTRFRVDTSARRYVVFMIQRWGYEPPTYKIFSDHVKRAFATANQPVSSD